jgi:hypothetical protein
MRRSVMNGSIRIIGILVAISLLFVGVSPGLCAEEVTGPESKKVTMNDPQFIPLADEQVIAKPVKWYYYALGAAVLGAAAGGAGGGSSSGPEDGFVTVGW